MALSRGPDIEGKERGDPDPRFHQSLFPLSEGNPLDLDLGVLRVLLSFFLSFSSLALVASVGFEREGLGHSVCPCNCIWCISLSCPRTLVDRKRKRYDNAVDVVVRLHDRPILVPKVRHLHDLHTFSSVTSHELMIQ